MAWPDLPELDAKTEVCLWYAERQRALKLEATRFHIEAEAAFHRLEMDRWAELNEMADRYSAWCDRLAIAWTAEMQGSRHWSTA
jgi:hypothetical protein